MDKIAIHVPNKWLSEAVQRKLFVMDYDWYIIDKKEIRQTEKRYLIMNESTLKITQTDSKDYCMGEGYTILTVDEFFKREGAAKVWPKRLSVEGVNVSVYLDKIHLVDAKDDDLIIAITWPEYDQIGTLRPGKGAG